MHGPTCMPLASLTPVSLQAVAAGGGVLTVDLQLLRDGSMNAAQVLAAGGAYHITRPLAPSYSLHTVLLKVKSYNDLGRCMRPFPRAPCVLHS
jgi:hypothetical protein